MKYYAKLVFFLLVFIQIGHSQWTQLNDLPFENHHSNGFGIGDKAYIIQGEATFVDDDFANVLWEYNVATDSWLDIGVFPGEPRGLAIGDDLDGKYYYGFGSNSNDLWVFDPETKLFEELPSCPCEVRRHPALVAHNGKVYMGAGSGSNGDLKDWWVYDIEAQVWSQKEDIPGGNRHHPYQFGIDDGIYVGGGHKENWLRFDVDNETWSEIDDFPEGRVAGTQFSHNGRGFVLAGDRVDHSALEVDQFLAYLPDTDEWIKLPFETDMHRWAPSSFIIGDFLYYFGGIGYLGGSNLRVWKYDLSSLDCLAPTGHFAPSTTETTANLLWQASTSGEVDTLQWREVGTDFWNLVLNPVPVFTLQGLNPCTEYEFRVNAICPNGLSKFSDPVSFLTKGCGSCIDDEFCDVEDTYTAFSTFIKRVKLNDIENITDSDNEQGYFSYTDFSSVNLSQTDSLEIEIEAGWKFGIYGGFVKSYIDYDGDGVFSEEELVLDASNVTETISETVYIPEDAALGIIRMRVMIAIDEIPYACDDSEIQDGEVEDYCLHVSEFTSIVDDEYQNISIFPNPISQIIHVRHDGAESFQIFDSTGELIKQGAIKNVFSTEDNVFQITTENITSGAYFIRIQSKTGTFTKRFIKI